MSRIMQADTERLFADWGEPALFQEMVREYDVATGMARARGYSQPVSVIRGENHPQLVNGVSATLGLTRQLLLVRKRDLPAGAVVESARLVLEETPYEVRTVRESSQAGVIVLDCLRLTVSDGPDACNP